MYFIASLLICFHLFCLLVYVNWLYLAARHICKDVLIYYFEVVIRYAWFDCCFWFWYLKACFVLYQQHRHENGETDTEMEEFVITLKMQVEIFVNRMKSNSSRGRSIANDSSVQTLFMTITAMHSRLLKHIQQQDDSRGEWKLPSSWESLFMFFYCQSLCLTVSSCWL